MPRRTAIEKVRTYEKKIEDIVSELPEFFSRLEVVLVDALLNRLLNIAPALTLIESIVRGGIDLRLTPVVLANDITRATVRMKREELKQLEGEVVELFKRLEMVLKWTALVDLCLGEGRIFVGPYEETILLDVYIDHFLVEAFASTASSSSLED